MRRHYFGINWFGWWRFPSWKHKGTNLFGFSYAVSFYLKIKHLNRNSRCWLFKTISYLIDIFCKYVFLFSNIVATSIVFRFNRLIKKWTHILSKFKSFINQLLRLFSDAICLLGCSKCWLFIVFRFKFTNHMPLIYKLHSNDNCNNNFSNEIHKSVKTKKKGYKILGQSSHRRSTQEHDYNSVCVHRFHFWFDFGVILFLFTSIYIIKIDFNCVWKVDHNQFSALFD